MSEMVSKNNKIVDTQLKDLEKIPVGISQCLMGEQVRYDGGHKHSAYCTQVLGKHFEYRPICPEVGAGLTIPRPAIRMIFNKTINPADFTPQNDQDGSINDAYSANLIDVVEVDQPDNRHTDAINEFSRKTVETLGDLDGYILMQKSPSCGMERVTIYHENGNPLHNGPGLYAKTLMDRWPNLPVEENGRINDPVLRENFLTRVFVHNDFRKFVEGGITKGGLIEFHSRYKYLLMAHHIDAYKNLGNLLSNLKDKDLEELAQEYFSQLMQALKTHATRKTHTNTLLHLMGYLKKFIGSEEKQELKELINQYRTGIVPLVVPIMLLRHHMMIFKEHCEYAIKQVYMQPHPHQLGLRNQI